MSDPPKPIFGFFDLRTLHVGSTNMQISKADMYPRLEVQKLNLHVVALRNCSHFKYSMYHRQPTLRMRFRDPKRQAIIAFMPFTSAQAIKSILTSFDMLGLCINPVLSNKERSSVRQYSKKVFCRLCSIT